MAEEEAEEEAVVGEILLGEVEAVVGEIPPGEVERASQLAAAVVVEELASRFWEGERVSLGVV